MLPAEWNQIIVAIGRASREMRYLLGWSQQALADRAITSQGAVSRLESGRAGDVPLRSVVIQLRTLAAGAETLDLPLSPTAETILGFSRTFVPEFSLTQPLDPELVEYILAYHRLPPERRKFALHLLSAAVDLFGAPTKEEPACPPIASS